MDHERYAEGWGGEMLDPFSHIPYWAQELGDMGGGVWIHVKAERVLASCPNLHIAKPDGKILHMLVLSPGGNLDQIQKYYDTIEASGLHVRMHMSQHHIHCQGAVLNRGPEGTWELSGMFVLRSSFGPATQKHLMNFHGKLLIPAGCGLVELAGGFTTGFVVPCALDMTAPWLSSADNPLFLDVNSQQATASSLVAPRSQEFFEGSPTLVRRTSYFAHLYDLQGNSSSNSSSDRGMPDWL
jgi:hypothetical protein